MAFSKNPAGKITLSCQCCGKPFEVWPSRGSQKFCSDACHREYRRQNKDYAQAIYDKIAASLTGRHPSEKTRQKMSESNKGNKSTLGKRGPESNNWKGGNSRRYKEGYRTLDHRKWREAVFERDDFTCQHCGQRGGYLHPHHVVPVAVDSSIRYEVDNGLTLCSSCHLAIDHYALIRSLREAC